MTAALTVAVRASRRSIRIRRARYAVCIRAKAKTSVAVAGILIYGTGIRCVITAAIVVTVITAVIVTATALTVDDAEVAASIAANALAVIIQAVPKQQIPQRNAARLMAAGVARGIYRRTRIAHSI